MKVLICKTRKSAPYGIEVATIQEAINAADKDEALWIVVNGILIGKTLKNTWEKVTLTLAP